MKEIGNLLREAREQKGISLEEVSKQTKIQEKYLKSLEEGDFTPFAGKVYVKGALKNYAAAIGMDAQEVVKLFDEAVKQNEVLDSKKEKGVLAEGGKPRFISKEKKPFPLVAFIWVLLLVLIVAGSIWYRYQQTSDPETAIPYNNEFIEEENDEHIAVEENDDEETINDQAENEIELEPEQKELIPISQDSREHVYSLEGVEQKEIVFEFTARCWVQIFQDEQKIEEKNFNPGEDLSVGDGDKTRIRLGYPEGVRMMVNGIEVESIRNIGSPLYVVIQKE